MQKRKARCRLIWRRFPSSCRLDCRRDACATWGRVRECTLVLIQCCTQASFRLVEPRLCGISHDFLSRHQDRN